MNPNQRKIDAESLLRAAAADLPENQPAALAELGVAFPELRIEAAVGRGGSGVVYRVQQSKLGRPAALKILDPALAAREPAFAERLQREGQAMAQLDHPGILKVYDFGERSGRYYLLTEYVDGIDLRKLLAMGELAPEEALRLVPQVCAALQYAHDRGIVHRDVKPENILLDIDGNVKLADFGLARLVGATGPGSHLTRDSQLLGTPHYMAPEQWRGAAVDHRADIFALGVVFYELLTGQLPVGDFAPPSQRTGVPRRLDQIVRKALAQDPGRRYQQAEELDRDLRTPHSEPVSPASASAPGPFVDVRAPGRRTTLLLGMGALAVVVSAVLYFLNSASTARAAAEAARQADWRAAMEAARQTGAPLQPEPVHGIPASMPPGFLVVGTGALLLILAVRLGFASIRRIQRAGGAADGLGFAEFLAWGLFVGAFDAAVLVPIAQMGGRYEGAVFAGALLLVVPLNVLFFTWRYRSDRAAIGRV